MLSEFVFFSLALMIFLAGLLVIFSKNPVQSVLFLVVVFCLSAQLFVLLEVDFLAMVLIIVYVGAIAVLFLFIVMMLNIRIVELGEILNRYFPLATIVGLIIFSEIIFSMYYSIGYSSLDNNLVYVDWYKSFLSHSNVVSLGLVLYTYFSPFLIISGILLLLAMISSIMLTLDTTTHSEFPILKKQSIQDQVERPINDLNFWKFY